jgi:MSHA biogenesis protein MshM
MPYLGLFGLKTAPFMLTPNPALYYRSPQQDNIVRGIIFALRRQSGVVKVVGDVGTGKTMLCHVLLRVLIDREPVAYINAPPRDERLIVRTVCHEFGVALEPGADPYKQLRLFLLEQHAQGRMPVLVIDEAQALGQGGLEVIRLLSNLETDACKLMQIVLFGQPELDHVLAGPAIRQLNQRIVHSFSTKRFSESETADYVRHRLNLCRMPHVSFDIFHPAALKRIGKACGGVARLINILADKSMLVAYAENAPRVMRYHVEDAIADSKGLLAPVPIWSRYSTQRILAAAIAAEATIAAVLAFLLLPGDEARPANSWLERAASVFEREAAPQSKAVAVASGVLEPSPRSSVATLPEGR